MKAERPYAQITITPKGEAALLRGHPWVYAGEVTEDRGAADGALVDVLSRRGSYLGTGFYNSRSTIRVRLLSRNANDTFDDAFWRRRIRYAWDYRKTVMGPEDRRCLSATSMPITATPISAANGSAGSRKRFWNALRRKAEFAE